MSGTDAVVVGDGGKAEVGMTEVTLSIGAGVGVPLSIGAGVGVPLSIGAGVGVTLTIGTRVGVLVSPLEIPCALTLLTTSALAMRAHRAEVWVNFIVSVV
ncbi:hypothetical protein BC938DRAFT_475879 [Jimgerdemannia flammicorona]|uniref:Uncharacterized protein n=1 Tax=Jimgerdemannia flammicorona TaxID=994334 RepID=A0A433QZ88_9FUNG|nr:hypothetical protein BC938DRAFT_475879 [Jimgerdemannia flammicorona]